jgi:hypothetical protein
MWALAIASLSGCGDGREVRVEVGSAAERSSGPEGDVRPAEVPGAHERSAEPPGAQTDLGDAEAVHAALRAWRDQRPQHLKLELTHVVQRGDRMWMGDPVAWHRDSPHVPRPLACEAWVGTADRALIASGRQRQLAFHLSTGSPLAQVGLPEEAHPGVRPSVGWSADDVPDAQALAGDLSRVLDLGALAAWLGNTPRWSRSLGRGGTVYHAEVRRPEPTASAWGAVVRIEVTLVVGTNGVWRELEIGVRRESGLPAQEKRETERSFPVWSTGGLRVGVVAPGALGPPARGGAERWAVAFPLEPLQHPDTYFTTSLSPGDPRLGDAAHERTTYLLRPNPEPVGAELGSFLEARRVAR